MVSWCSLLDALIRKRPLLLRVINGELQPLTKGRATREKEVNTQSKTWKLPIQRKTLHSSKANNDEKYDFMRSTVVLKVPVSPEFFAIEPRESTISSRTLSFFTLKKAFSQDSTETRTRTACKLSILIFILHCSVFCLLHSPHHTNIYRYDWSNHLINLH